jgi:excisionase family DNA binding protein
VEPLETEDVALTVREACNCFIPPVSDQTVYRMIWAGKLRVLNQAGIIRIPRSELKKFFGKVTVYKSRRTKKTTK